MNDALEFLLSKVYDGAGAPEHLADLRKSGLSDETIAANLIRSVPPAMIDRLLGFNLPAMRSALLFPYRSPDGGFADLARVKIFPALTDADGHTIKYLQPRGSPPRLYFVAACLREILEGAGPLYLVEGEKKALAVAQLGLAAVGFAGIEGWHRKGSQDLLDDFKVIRLEERPVKLVPDGDWQTNPDVDRGVRRLARALHARGAVPRLLVLPPARIEAR